MGNKPYIGITGFKTKNEVKEVSKLFEENLGKINNSHTAMFGFVTSTKRLEDYTKPGKTSPAVRDLQDLVYAVPDSFFPVLHHFTTNLNRLYDEVCQLHLQTGYGWGLQINSVWPLSDQVRRIKGAYPNKKIILQIPKEAIEKTEREIEYPGRLKKYSGLIDYVLIDPSGGLGMDFDTTSCINLMNFTSEILPEVGVGLAGGLCASNVATQIWSVANKYGKPFSVDAEGKLRVDTYDGQFLYSKQVKSYIENFVAGIEEVRKRQLKPQSKSSDENML